MAGKKNTGEGEEMSWISRKLFLYNVTIGLYGLDWWERYLSNTIVLNSPVVDLLQRYPIHVAAISRAPYNSAVKKLFHGDTVLNYIGQ